MCPVKKPLGFLFQIQPIFYDNIVCCIYIVSNLANIGEIYITITITIKTYPKEENQKSSLLQIYL